MAGQPQFVFGGAPTLPVFGAALGGAAPGAAATGFEQAPQYVITASGQRSRQMPGTPGQAVQVVKNPFNNTPLSTTGSTYARLAGVAPALFAPENLAPAWRAKPGFGPRKNLSFDAARRGGLFAASPQWVNTFAPDTSINALAGDLAGDGRALPARPI